MKTLTKVALGLTSVVTITTTTFTGQQQLNDAEKTIESYNNKVIEVVDVAKSLKEENKNLVDQLNGKTNTENEVNELIEYNKVLQHRVGILEEENIQLREELEKANQAASNHLKNISNILDESILDEVLGE